MFRNLIDETLQIQEAAAKKIEISRDELNQNFARVAANFNIFAGRLHQISGVAQARPRPASSARLKVSSLEPRAAPRSAALRQSSRTTRSTAVIDRLKAAKGTDEYRISEIYLSAAPDKTDQVSRRAQQIMNEIKQGGSFPAYARRYSEASTAAVGGDLGWVRPALLPSRMLNVVQTMQMGQIAGPVQVPGGFDIIFLQDKRQVLTADPRDLLLSLKQVSIDFAPGMTEEQKQQRANELAAGAKELKGVRRGQRSRDEDQAPRS